MPRPTGSALGVQKSQAKGWTEKTSHQSVSLRRMPSEALWLYQPQACPPARAPSLCPLLCQLPTDSSAAGGFCSFLLITPHPWPLCILAAAAGPCLKPHPVLVLASQSTLCPSTPRLGIGHGPGLLTDPSLCPQLVTVSTEQTLSFLASMFYNPDCPSTESHHCTSDAAASLLLTQLGGLSL